jgi:hypothetical protein
MATPFDVTGVAYDPAGGCAYVRIEGFDKSVSYRADEITKLLCKFGDVDRINAALRRMTCGWDCADWPHLLGALVAYGGCLLSRQMAPLLSQPWVSVIISWIGQGV